MKFIAVHIPRRFQATFWRNKVQNIDKRICLKRMVEWPEKYREIHAKMERK